MKVIYQCTFPDDFTNFSRGKKIDCLVDKILRTRFTFHVVYIPEMAVSIVERLP